MTEDIKIEINGKMYVGWEKISKKVKISASLLRAVNVVVSLKNIKPPMSLLLNYPPIQLKLIEY